jgi:hypothetical protein
VGAHTFTKQATKFRETLSAHQVADGNCFLGQERSCGGGFYATRDHSIIKSVFETLKTLCMAIQNKRHGLLTSSVLLLHDSVCHHTAACPLVLLEHFSWQLFDHRPHSRDFTLIGCYLCTYPKTRLKSQHFNNNEEIMEGVIMWLSSQVADFFDTGVQKLIDCNKCLNSASDYFAK